jgi:hypothetical protein
MTTHEIAKARAWRQLMAVRRVVTAKNADGKSVIISDGPSPREMALKHTPGFVSAPIWMSAGTPKLPAAGHDPMSIAGHSLLPKAGGSTFIIVTFPPDSVMMSADFDPAKAGPEHLVATPGIAETFEMDNPGMHTTPTVDYAVVATNLALDVARTALLKSNSRQLISPTYSPGTPALGKRVASSSGTRVW